jgi:hypothetical protein
VPSLTTEQRRSIDLAKEQLVGAAETLLDTAELRPDEDEFGHSQLRNLEKVAGETESPAVVLNFIRYQMGRDQKAKKNWARMTPAGQMGDLFISALNNDEGNAVSTALANVPHLKEDPLAQQLARIMVIRYFLGFTTRYLKYLELKFPKTRKERKS